MTVESPLGGFLSLPASETDLWIQQASKVKTVGKFLPEKLLRLGEWVAARSEFVTSSASSVADNKGIEHTKEDSHDTKASTKHPTRKAKSPNKANGTVSRQDTQKPKSRRGDSKE